MCSGLLPEQKPLLTSSVGEDCMQHQPLATALVADVMVAGLRRREQLPLPTDKELFKMCVYIYIYICL